MEDGVGSSARFNCPRGLDLLGAETLLVCDHSNHRIRAVDLRTRSVTTMAGDGQQGHRDGRAEDGQLCCPVGIAVLGPKHNLVDSSECGPHEGQQQLVFVTCEQGNCRGDAVRVLTPRTGALYTLHLRHANTASGGSDAGPASSGFEGDYERWCLDYPGGLTVADYHRATVDAALFIADRVGHVIQGVSIAAATAAAAAAAAAAPLAMAAEMTTVAQAQAALLFPADVSSEAMMHVEPAGSRGPTLTAAKSAVWTVAGTRGCAGGDDGPGTVAKFFRPRCCSITTNMSCDVIFRPLYEVNIERAHCSI
eukprot:SAG31_NODE_998_length_10460_cov_255.143505_10_plen_308_part_00